MAIEKDKLNEFIEKMKEEAKKIGLDIEEKLDDAKDKWAETATTDPDMARRQLRSFWGDRGLYCRNSRRWICRLHVWINQAPKGAFS